MSTDTAPARARKAAARARSRVIYMAVGEDKSPPVEQPADERWTLGMSHLGGHEGQWCVTRGRWPNVEFLVKWKKDLNEVVEALLIIIQSKQPALVEVPEGSVAPVLTREQVQNWRDILSRLVLRGLHDPGDTELLAALERALAEGKP